MSFLLRDVLLDPTAAVALDNAELHQLIAQGRTSRLLASLALGLRQSKAMQQLAPQVRRHLDSSLVIHDKQRRDLVYECDSIRDSLAAVDLPLILLKGAAYLMAGLPVAAGRLITDIDILVPRDRIDAAEQALVDAGWLRSEVDSYDEKYYREWGHEIPPLTHPRRGTTLDVHHNILPPTCAPNVNAQLLFANAVEVTEGIYTLSPADLVIHSATHLFHEGEFIHGLRDLWDLDRMLRDFPGQQDGFWEELVQRAEQLELSGPLYHGLSYTQQVFATPVPAGVTRSITSTTRSLRKPLMDFLYLRAFRPDNSGCRLPWTGLALQCLYLRSHYLRMPLYLLLPHLARKAWKKRFAGKSTPDQDEATVA